MYVHRSCVEYATSMRGSGGRAALLRYHAGIRMAVHGHDASMQPVAGHGCCICNNQRMMHSSFKTAQPTAQRCHEITAGKEGGPRGHTGGSLDGIKERSKSICSIVAHLVDEHAGDPLEPHARVNVFGRQFQQISACFAVELNEHHVPDLQHVGVIHVDKLWHKAATDSVIVDLCAWPTGPLHTPTYDCLHACDSQGQMHRVQNYAHTALYLNTSSSSRTESRFQRQAGCSSWLSQAHSHEH